MGPYTALRLTTVSKMYVLNILSLIDNGFNVKSYLLKFRNSNFVLRVA